MNIFILGAVFSKPVGLPLGNDLFPKVLKAAKEPGYYNAYSLTFRKPICDA